MTKPVMPLKWYKNLATREGRIQEGLFVVEGMRSIRQIVGKRPDSIKELVAVEGVELIKDCPVRIVTEKQFAQISSVKTPQGIMAIVSIPRHAYENDLPGSPGQKVLVLEDIQDPGNLGTLIRTAAAFNFAGILMSDKTADPFSPKCVQSAAGSVLSLWIRRTSFYLELAARLKSGGYRIVAASLEGESNQEFFNTEKLVVALGNEAAGLSKQITSLADYRFSIPIDRKQAESLNVAVSGGIIMYLATRA
jgi:TrmH family RNA methyltransferase